MIKKFFNLLFFFTLVLYVNFINSKEVLIYADNISYDKEENLIARGNAKIIKNMEYYALLRHISMSELHCIEDRREV